MLNQSKRIIQMDDLTNLAVAEIMQEMRDELQMREEPPQIVQPQEERKVNPLVPNTLFLQRKLKADMKSNKKSDERNHARCLRKLRKLERKEKKKKYKRPEKRKPRPSNSSSSDSEEDPHYYKSRKLSNQTVTGTADSALQTFDPTAVAAATYNHMAMMAWCNGNAMSNFQSFAMQNTCENNDSSSDISFENVFDNDADAIPTSSNVNNHWNGNNTANASADSITIDSSTSSSTDSFLSEHSNIQNDNPIIISDSADSSEGVISLYSITSEEDSVDCIENEVIAIDDETSDDNSEAVATTDHNSISYSITEQIQLAEEATPVAQNVITEIENVDAQNVELKSPEIPQTNDSTVENKNSETIEDTFVNNKTTKDHNLENLSQEEYLADDKLVKSLELEENQEENLADDKVLKSLELEENQDVAINVQAKATENDCLPNPELESNKSVKDGTVKQIEKPLATTTMDKQDAVIDGDEEIVTADYSCISNSTFNKDEENNVQIVGTADEESLKLNEMHNAKDEESQNEPKENICKINSALENDEPVKDEDKAAA